MVYIPIIAAALFFGSFHTSAAETEAPTVVVTTIKAAKATGCWATLYDEAGFQGDEITIYDGIDLPRMKFADGTNWTGRVSSITTGPKARLTLYGEEYWKDKDYVIAPDALISSFDQLPMNYVESLRLKCLP